MNKRKKASYGMKKMRGGDYMEPNKELKFGAAKGMKPKRRKAGDGDTVSKAKHRGGSEIAEDTRAAVSSAGERIKEIGSQLRGEQDKKTGSAAGGAGAARRRKMQEETTSSSPNPPASTDPKKGTPVGSQAAKDIKNPYAAAKKRDSNLDSYVKQRNAADKGSLEYNEAQNKINKAYGKGPTDRRTTYGPEKKGENVAKVASKKASTISSGAGPKLQTRSTPAPAAKTPTKKESRQATRADNKEGRLQDRRASAAKRKSARSRKDTAVAAQKEQGATRGMQRAAGRMTKANIKGNEAKANRAVNKFQDKSKRAAAKAKVSAIKKEGKAALADARGRKRAMTGLAVQGAGAALQGVGKLTNAIAGKETKFGNIADTVGSTAVTAGGMMGGVPGAQGALNAVKGAVPPPGGAGAAPTPADPNAPTDPNATTQPDPNALPAAKYGRKKKGKKGMMKYKTGGAKPDFPDLDKDGNKTESMKSALKDRRSKARKGRYKAQMGTNIKGKDGLTPRQRQNARDFKKENSYVNEKGLKDNLVKSKPKKNEKG